MDLPEPASARAYRLLERLIVTLELPPGSLTTEGAIVARTGCGRTPVREAIQRLAWEGLLDVRPRAGLAVAPLHAGDWRKVIEARRGVEIILARAAARFVTDEGAARFNQAFMQMQKSVITGNVAAFLDADKALDEAMAGAADNAFASRLAAPLQTHSRRFWFRYQADTGLAQAADGHLRMIRAILAGDTDGAGAAAAELMDMLAANAAAASQD
jgi:DNA-binding GntR family transcriptional regulator